jgi:hypothetical protein
MRKNMILSHIALLSMVFATAHVVALKLSLYWTTGWFDLVMHLFGGFLGTLIVVYVLQKVGISPRTLPRKMFLLAFVVISVFAIGVVWELWEIFIGFTDPFDKMVQVDTIIDLVIGIIGSLVAFIFYDKRLRTKAE